MITGMIRPNQGHIFLDDENITHLPMYKRAQKGIGYLAQEPSVFRKLSVEDNLKLVLEMYMKDKKEIRDKIDALIDEFKLDHVRKSKGFMLSGGERRRTEIARALATDPKFILLDEPFAGIDPIAVEDIQDMVVNLKNKGIGVIITDHNVHETLSITDHSYLLYQGNILKAGTAEFLANDPEARRLYLGAKFKLDR
jgi:lipopolysaccharide export system ATP-binding protein